jgi:UDPglucose--hexose-1-phosphate uridylyltransferase
VLNRWRDYTDESVFIFAETGGEPHNTVTPIARRRGYDYELDLVLRNNITTEEFPLGVYHPHQDLHHIKKENIGLIEVMGLAVLPSRLLTELDTLEKAMLSGADLHADPMTAVHAGWAEEIMQRRSFNTENAEAVLREEVGAVFQRVLEDAGVFKRDAAGRAAFRRFLDAV